MDLKQTYRMRVESCIGTILDVHKVVSEEYENQAFLNQFEEMKRDLDKLDMGLVSEGDILLIENATNALLREFRILYDRCDLGPVYPTMKS